MLLFLIQKTARPKPNNYLAASQLNYLKKMNSSKLIHFQNFSCSKPPIFTIKFSKTDFNHISIFKSDWKNCLFYRREVYICNFIKTHTTSDYYNLLLITLVFLTVLPKLLSSSIRCSPDVCHE